MDSSKQSATNGHRTKGRGHCLSLLFWGGRRFDAFPFVELTATPDGATQNNLTQGNEPELDPAWSPNGKKKTRSSTRQSRRDGHGETQH